MGFLMAYLLFALTTAIAAMYELILPVYRELQAEKAVTPLLEYKWIGLSTFFIFCVLVAPLVFFPSIIPKSGVRFREALKTSILAAKI